ncbi:MAG: hypothetical protein KA369_14715 [Spirochaetes bacterium]|nr:hypothetical protein [Spirochaetota bacterium]
MNIETTINLNSYIFSLISRAALLTGLSKSDIISSVMRRLGDDYENMTNTWTRVRYQKRDANPYWHILHITLKPDEYEYFLDLRKVFKFSVSCLVAIAVEKYLDEIMKMLSENIDIYRYCNYLFTRRIIDGVVCWILSWGVPRHLISDYYWIL